MEYNCRGDGQSRWEAVLAHDLLVGGGRGGKKNQTASSKLLPASSLLVSTYWHSLAMHSMLMSLEHLMVSDTMSCLISLAHKMLLLPGVPCSKHPNNQCLHHHFAAPYSQHLPAACTVKFHLQASTKACCWFSNGIATSAITMHLFSSSAARMSGQQLALSPGWCS